MKIILVTAATLGVLLAGADGGAANRHAPSHPFGLGIMVGAPTGLTAKLYLAAPFALQMGIGVVDDLDHDDFDDDDGLHLHLDAVWHPVILTRNASVTLPLYLGVGVRLFENDDRYRWNGDWYEDDDLVLGVRAPFGFLIDFNRLPLDIFFEVALVVNVVDFDDDDGPFDDDDDDRLGINGGIGIRYYF